MRLPDLEEPPRPSPLWRWLVVWALLTLTYVAAGWSYRALTAGGSFHAPGHEDLIHWILVPLVQTGALALVARLRRQS